VRKIRRREMREGDDMYRIHGDILSSSVCMSISVPSANDE
jgi:hypothetical protein